MKKVKNNNCSKMSFKNELDKIALIHFEAKYYFKDLEYILESDIKSIANKSNEIFINRILSSFWKLGIIELSKLFQESRNQHYNLFSFILSLNNCYDKTEWTKELPIKKTQEWINLLNSNENKSTIKKIIILRDKYYAHTDRNTQFEINELDVSLKEINLLLKATEEIISNLSVVYFDSDWDYEISEIGSAFKLIEAFKTLEEKIAKNIRKEFEN